MSASTGDQGPQRARLRYATVGETEEEIRWDTEHRAAVRDEVRTLGRDLRRAIPDVYRGYAALHGAALAPGALDTKTKELLALAIGVTRECDGCIAAHAYGAALNGATEAEVAEALGVALLMNGGPATVVRPACLRRLPRVRLGRAGCTLTRGQ